ncbi:MAG: triose-phosphate isomerase [SAR202 cluster bacterium]|nr:triose-phosphate isomerase [SAR202 cluster bacterium]
MPRFIAAGNWKMNTTLPEAKALALAIPKALNGPPPSHVETIICPPYISLAVVRDALRGSGIVVGAQNAHWEQKGAFTGEVSPSMLKDLCEYVIVGHSERRHVMGESDDTINRKVKAVYAAGLKPILCVGETLEQRQRDGAEGVVRRQLESGLNGVRDISELVIAYEPVWAIGTGVAATPDTVREITSGAIRAEIAKLHGSDIADEVPVLYGGSANPDNASGFLKEPSIQGTLIGGASLNAEQFAKIVRLTAEIKGGSVK